MVPAAAGWVSQICPEYVLTLPAAGCCLCAGLRADRGLVRGEQHSGVYQNGTRSLFRDDRCVVRFRAAVSERCRLGPLGSCQWSCLL